MSASLNAENIIKMLDMTPLEFEGGYCREFYRGKPRSADDPRMCSSSIYYLMRLTDRSCWHKLDADEIWFFHSGLSALQYVITPDCKLNKYILGNNLTTGEIPQNIIPAESWQSTKVFLPVTGELSADYSLFSTVVSPGFELSAFSGASVDEMIKLFPQYQTEIEEFATSPH